MRDRESETGGEQGTTPHVRRKREAEEEKGRIEVRQRRGMKGKRGRRERRREKTHKFTNAIGSNRLNAGRSKHMKRVCGRPQAQPCSAIRTNGATMDGRCAIQCQRRPSPANQDAEQRRVIRQADEACSLRTRGGGCQLLPRCLRVELTECIHRGTHRKSTHNKREK